MRKWEDTRVKETDGEGGMALVCRPTTQILDMSHTVYMSQRVFRNVVMYYNKSQALTASPASPKNSISTHQCFSVIITLSSE